jgi:outer membrane lipoprotein SlyB|tara:strand:- start:575 stop:790 length:216 start_codon:yes stop_codon:yes gene_type:complete
MKKILVILLLGIFVNACSGSARDVSTLGGCAVGGITGSKIGKGQGNTAATIIGTALGCAAGNEVGKSIEGN